MDKKVEVRPGVFISVIKSQDLKDADLELKNLVDEITKEDKKADDSESKSV